MANSTNRENSIRIDKDRILDLFSSEAYLTINKRLLQAYGPEVAVFLSNLVDKYKYHKVQNTLVEKDWFYCTNDEQIGETGLTLYKIRACKDTLKDDKILHTKMVGNPAKQFYRISLSTLMNKLDEQLHRKRLTKLHRKRHPSINNISIDIIHNNKHKYKRTQGSLPHGSLMSAKSRSKEYLPLAKMLSKIIQRTKNILHTSNQLKSWSNEIRILVETQQVDISRVKEVLKWYRTHVGGEYIPVVESGRSLRDKFTRLEAAMQREAKPKKENTTYKKYTADKRYREDGYV